MSYQVSAIKWRPQTFDEVVGQRYITKTLKNALDNDRIAHAFLFSGMHGVGKTTLARILAKALNCENGPTSKPCTTCDTCVDIAAGSHTDVIEIDGASNTGVDDVRDLRERVRYAPAKARYKVYIVDEVHMLSKAAFNAFLKTLEEPPSKTVFIFATTETQKIPETIISRCQNFDFKRLPFSDIAGQLKKIADSSSIKISDVAIKDIIRSANGSLRDALVAFDQVVSFSGKNVTNKDVKGILGIVGTGFMGSLMDSILSNDPTEILSSVAKLNEIGTDLKIFIRELMEYIRHLMVAKSVKEPEKFVELDNIEIKKIVSQSRKIDQVALQSMFQIVIQTDSNVRQSSNPYLVVEMGLLRLMTVRDLVGIDELIEKVDSLPAPSFVHHERPDNAEMKARPNEKKPTQNEEPPPYEEYEAEVRDPKGEMGERPGRDDASWRKIKDKVGEKKPILGGILENMQFVDITEKELILGFKKENSQIFLEDLDSEAKFIKDVIKDVLGRELTLVFKEPQKAEKKKSPDTDKWKKQTIQNVLDYFPGTVTEHSGKL
ncbi:MAG: DNA polymerase III subunit gamma/tau [Nitrospinota bacterium]